MQNNYSLAFVAGLKRATDEGSLPEIAQYSPYYLPLNDFTASKGSILYILFPTMYWLPKLHKRPYKAKFIANSSSCTTTELSKLLTSCLTAIKSHVIRYCETVYENSNKKWFWSIKNSGEVLSKLKCRGFRAKSLSTYDFSTLYTTLPHKLIKEKLLDLIEWTLKRVLKNYGSLYLACNDRKAFSLPLTKVGIHFGHVMCATPYPISWIIFIRVRIRFGTKLHKLLEFRWVQIAHL